MKKMLAFPISTSSLDEYEEVNEDEEDYYFNNVSFFLSSSSEKSIIDSYKNYNWKVVDSFIVLNKNISVKFSTSFSSKEVYNPIRKKYDTKTIAIFYDDDIPPSIEIIDKPLFFNRDNVLWAESTYILKNSDISFVIALPNDPILKLIYNYYWYSLETKKWYIKVGNKWEITIKPKLRLFQQSHNKLSNAGFLAPWGKDTVKFNNEWKQLFIDIIR